MGAEMGGKACLASAARRRGLAMTKPTKPRQHPITRDMPLPGHYGVLTMQLNVTRYHPAGTVRFTLVVREPVSGLEVRRVVQETETESDQLDKAILFEVDCAMTDMLWLQTGHKGL
uniref:Uncharacterized protein n=1 Tax=uncultured prokaryote TaxID=198431 RepID=A0A0H5Q3Q2_9ZZZZ|nr:hypothetical protein [uncultured prokaryote]